ncbi:hypothetical protein [Salinarimonas sp.]|uniref:hypothetical protein n=1 Tax=Salinarimonas sp. TaxID=2766526 RepID=UPI00391D504F
MALTAFEKNLVAALRAARPFVEQAQQVSGGITGTGEIVLIDGLLTAATKKDAQRESSTPAAPTFKPGPRCKRTPDMFGGAKK